MAAKIQSLIDHLGCTLRSAELWDIVHIAAEATYSKQQI